MANQAGRRTRGNVEPVVFWLRSDGDLMLAPHTQMPCFPGYQRVECTTLPEITKYSKKMAQIEENKLRGLKIEEQLRAIPKWDEMIARCKQRLENGCISEMDEAMTRHTLASAERKRGIFMRLMFEKEAMTESCLEIEKREAPIGMAQYQQKSTEIH